MDWDLYDAKRDEFIAEVSKHLGPGNHPSGSTQDVHGDGGGGGWGDKSSWRSSNSIGISGGSGGSKEGWADNLMPKRPEGTGGGHDAAHPAWRAFREKVGGEQAGEFDSEDARNLGIAAAVIGGAVLLGNSRFVRQRIDTPNVNPLRHQKIVFGTNHGEIRFGVAEVKDALKNPLKTAQVGGAHTKIAYEHMRNSMRHRRAGLTDVWDRYAHGHNAGLFHLKGRRLKRGGFQELVDTADSAQDAARYGSVGRKLAEVEELGSFGDRRLAVSKLVEEDELFDKFGYTASKYTSDFDFVARLREYQFAADAAPNVEYDRFINVVAQSEAPSPRLYRGIKARPEMAELWTKVGGEFELPVSSFTPDALVAEGYARASGGAAKTVTGPGRVDLLFEVEGAYGVNMDHFTHFMQGITQDEWLTAGKFQVVETIQEKGFVRVKIKQTARLAIADTYSAVTVGKRGEFGKHLMGMHDQSKHGNKKKQEDKSFKALLADMGIENDDDLSWQEAGLFAVAAIATGYGVNWRVSESAEDLWRANRQRHLSSDVLDMIRQRPSGEVVEVPTKVLYRNVRGMGYRVGQKNRIRGLANHIQKNPGWLNEKPIQVRVFKDGLFIDDGMHRIYAAHELGLKSAPIQFKVMEGSVPKPRGFDASVQQIKSSKIQHDLLTSQRRTPRTRPFSTRPDPAWVEAVNNFMAERGEINARRKMSA